MVGFGACILYLLGLVSVQFVSAAQDMSICTSFVPTAGPTKPDLSIYTAYEMRAEVNIVNRNYTTDYHEFYDYKNRRAATHSMVGGSRNINIYSFNTNELFTIDEDNNVCKASNLATSPFLFLFGRPNGPNNATMSTVSNTFEFSSNNISEQYIGQTNIRGVPCNQWRSCVYMQGIDATMVVDWYFSDPSWHTSSLLTQIPVRAHVKGVSNAQGMKHNFDHFYDFTYFSPYIEDPTVFEINARIQRRWGQRVQTPSPWKIIKTPEGAYCIKRNLTLALPTPAGHFHFTAEVLDLGQNVIGGIKEYYDYDLKLVRFDLTPMGVSPYGSNPQTQVHDFTTGISYIIDQRRGNCSITNISSIGFDVHSIDPSHVRIRTAKEFFYFDKTQCNYEGTKMARGILCDVWITRRTDYPEDHPGTPSTWEWYFATPTYTANLPDTLTFGMPIMLEVNIGTNGQDGRITYNIYDYDEQKPDIWEYDISRCFNNTARKDFSLLLPGSYETMASANTEAFKYAVLNAIKTSGNGVSPLRINNIQVDYANASDITVRFTLLDRPPPIGDVTNPKLEPDLNTVANLLTTAINNGTFKVTMPASGQQNPVTMTAIPFSLKPSKSIVKRVYVKHVNKVITTTTGFSGGVMAGMGVALLVVFFAIGVFVMYMYYRRQGGAFLPKKFDNVDITQDTS